MGVSPEGRSIARCGFSISPASASRSRRMSAAEGPGQFDGERVASYAAMMRSAAARCSVVRSLADADPSARERAQRVLLATGPACGSPRWARPHAAASGAPSATDALPPRAASDDGAHVQRGLNVIQHDQRIFASKQSRATSASPAGSAPPAAAALDRSARARGAIPRPRRSDPGRASTATPSARTSLRRG